MEGLFVLAIVATPFVFAGWLIHRIFEHRLRVKQLEGGVSPLRALPPAIAHEVDPEIERRVAALEAIVCDLDFDLANRLRAVGKNPAA